MPVKFPSAPLQRPRPAVVGVGYAPALVASIAQVSAEVMQLQRQMMLASTRRPEVLCMSGSRLFAPDGQAFACDTAQNGVSSQLVNFVVRDGVTYDIPVQMAGPGAFVVDSIAVHCYQRLYIPAYGAPCWFPMVPNTMNIQFAFAAVQGTRRFSLYPLQPDFAGSGTTWPSVGFVWNFSDPLTGRELSDEWIADGALLPQSQYHTGGGLMLGGLLDDGGRFDLPVGWAFKAGTRAVLNWRPISPVLQFDSSIAGNAAGVGLPGLPFDDRESNIRDQSVRVDVELFGYRYSEGA